MKQIVKNYTYDLVPVSWQDSQQLHVYIQYEVSLELV